jgi:tripartite-type tricarboxylate transporter receptor subunit TctC
LHTELNKVLSLTEVQQQVTRVGIISVVSPPLDELPPFIASEMVRWGKVVEKVGLIGSE